MKYSEQAIVFPCAGEQLLGIVAQPEQAESTGVLIIVGGRSIVAAAIASSFCCRVRWQLPATRQCVSTTGGWATAPASCAISEAVESDIAAAVDAFMAASPELERIVLWGLCDAASASLLYLHAHKDERLGGLVLLNPWVRSEATLARAHIKHYCPAPAATGVLAQAVEWQPGYWARHWRFAREFEKCTANQLAGKPGTLLPGKMCCAMTESVLPTLLILSGNDYTAKEFVEATQIAPAWQQVLAQKRVSTCELADADHTFSSASGVWLSKKQRLAGCRSRCSTDAGVTGHASRISGFRSILLPPPSQGYLCCRMATSPQVVTIQRTYRVERPWQGRASTSAGAAMHWVKPIGGRSDGNALLAPAYHCVTMLDPALALGSDVQLYPLSADLVPIIPALDQLLERSGKPVKVLFTHFLVCPRLLRVETMV
jgi:exosortase A-associated hydrolase 1